VDEIADAIRLLLHKVSGENHAYEPLGVGIAAWPINLRSGILGLLPNLPGWDNFPSETDGEAIGLRSFSNATPMRLPSLSGSLAPARSRGRPRWS